eukprot:TRINITY_DN7369_c0_g1_i2.p1 TRINITY_DN7369_c0_g1~~TRINITY_DN7369_c0_g1_i2.p1  ORF type:complete len:719 (+),score=205.10 TRINITY_DN7369_c0_g1_i2:158-2314(+)
MASNAATLNTTDLSRMSQDDRMAVMRMVAEGELTVEEAINKVKGQTGTDRTMTMGKLSTLIGKGNFDRRKRGAFRQNRGRLYLEIMVQKASAFSVLALTIKEGRDLLAMNKNNTATPYVKVYMEPDLPKSSKKKTQPRKNTVNPMFNEQFTWEIRTGTNVENMKLHIQVFEQAKLRRSQFMGSMAFPLNEIFEAGIMEGWFKLLDQKKGVFQYIPFRPKVKDDTGASTRGRAKAKAPAPPKVSPQPKPAPAVSASSAGSKSGGAMESVNHGSFNYLKVLGQGSFGKVLMAEHKSSSEIYAVKVLKKEVVVEDDDVECTMIERRVLELSGGCAFLTKLVATFQTNEHLYFVMEFITGGDLMFHIQRLKRFSTDQTRFYAGEICLGLWYLHKSGVLYRDLKLDNVMLAGDGHIKIADFGMCKENIWGAATTTTFCGTPGYLAPEIIQELPYGASVDWWSLGVLCYEMLIGDSPFEGDDEEELFDEILRKKLAYPSRLDATCRKLLDGLLVRDPNKRLGCGRNGRSDIQGHPFFAGMDWDKLEKREITPPYVPEAKDPRAAANFDPEFTEASTQLTPCDAYAIANIDQTAFRNFSFVNNAFFGGEAAPTPEANRRPALFEYSWYRPDLPREEAARNLKGQAVGTFYVRESSSQPGCYAIAMVSENNKIWNGLVTPSVTGDNRVLYKLFVKQKFESLPELVTYYTKHPVTTGPSGNKLCLRV